MFDSTHRNLDFFRSLAKNLEQFFAGISQGNQV